MRISPYLREYKKIEEQYRSNNSDVPASVKADYQAKEYIDSLWRLLNKCADGNAISNATWDYFGKIQEREKDPDTSEDMAERIDAAIKEILILYNELKDEENGFLIDTNTLTRNGRKRVRESAVRIGLLLRRLHENYGYNCEN